jgi:hypothetical protein
MGTQSSQQLARVAWAVATERGLALGPTAEKRPANDSPASPTPRPVPKSPAPWPRHRRAKDGQRNEAQFWKAIKMCFFLLNKLVYIW